MRRKWATKRSWDWHRKPPKLRTEISIRSEEKNLRTTKVLLQKPRDLRKSRLQKKSLRKPETLRAPSRAQLFRKLLRDDPETQWDRIVSKMQSKNPWEDLTRYKWMNLHPKSYASLLDCIEFHKRTFFSMDAAEKLRYYLMCCVKKPMKVTIKAHVTRMEILNRYIGMLPTIKNSLLAVPSTKRGNIPFTKATHASIILSQLPLAWRNQCNLTHQTVLESPCDAPGSRNYRESHRRKVQRQSLNQ